MPAHTVNTLVVTTTLADSLLDRLKKLVPTVHYHPDGNVPDAALAEVDVLFTSWLGVPRSIDSFSKTPNLAHVQLLSAGADKAVQSPAFLDALAHGRHDVSLGSASGTHVLSIPPHCLMATLALYHQLQQQVLIAQNEARWAKGTEIPGLDEDAYYVRSIRGKTVALLGYGHLARETARLFQVFGVTIIAANSSGTRKLDVGYIIPGTGDRDASIPSEFYSTSDAESLKAFLSRTDILIASLPSTSATKYMLDAEKLSWLPDNAVFVNVGRGDLVKSEDLLTTLNRPGGLYGAALDVTDPEPLPNEHPLFTHPRVIITHHLSGNAEGERGIAVDILALNVERLRKGEKLVNLVDLEKGY